MFYAYLFVFSLFCVFVFVLTMFYDSLNAFSFTFFCNGSFVYLILCATFNVFFFSIAHVAWISLCSMPLYLYFFLFLCLCFCFVNAL